MADDAASVATTKKPPKKRKTIKPKPPAQPALVVPEVSTKASVSLSQAPTGSQQTIHGGGGPKKKRKTKRSTLKAKLKESQDDSTYNVLLDSGLAVPRKSDHDNHAHEKHKKESIGSLDLLFSQHDTDTSGGFRHSDTGTGSLLDDRISSKPKSATSERQDYAKEWIYSFRLLKILLIIFGQWPYSFTEDLKGKGYVFEFNWKSSGFMVFVWTCVFNFFGLIISGVNVIDILMRDKVNNDTSRRTKTDVIEQGLVERHTMLVVIMLGSYGLNLINLLLTLSKRKEIADIFTKWTSSLTISKLHTGSIGTNTYMIPVLVNYGIVSVTILLLSIFRVSPTFTGGPTVISIMFVRFFLPYNYLERGFPGSIMHWVMHAVGLFLFFYVTFTANVSMYMFLWLVKSIKNAICCWNERLSDTVEMVHLPQEEMMEDDVDYEAKERMNFVKLYNDHIVLVRMLKWLNSMYAGILEPWLLFMTVRVVYQIYLAALVLQGNGKPINKKNEGKYFRRQRDYIPAFLISFENIFMVVTVLMAAAWMQDMAYESYDEIREVSLLKGPASDKESLFMLSMFQSYISTTKMAVYAGDYFSIDRYTVLHFLSAVMSNFLVVYQFRPLFDTDTSNPDFANTVRKTIGNFLTGFENLPRDHLKIVDDAVRYKASS